MDGVCWAAEMFCNTRLVFFIVDNVSSVFVKSVFKSSASLSDVLAVLPYDYDGSAPKTKRSNIARDNYWNT